MYAKKKIKELEDWKEKSDERMSQIRKEYENEMNEIAENGERHRENPVDFTEVITNKCTKI